MLNTVVTDEVSIYVVRGAFNYYISTLGGVGGLPGKLTFDYLISGREGPGRKCLFA